MDLAESIGLTPVTTRDAADGNPPLDEGEEILQSFDNVQLILAGDADQGLGKVIITEGRIFWLSSSNLSLGFAVDFPDISMHAVATDPGTVDRPCMYIQIDQGSEDEGYGAEGSDEEEAPSAPLPELRLVPVNADMLDAMFKAFCEGAERNPDFGAEEEGQGNLFFDQGEVLAGAFDPDLDEGNDVEDLVGGDPDRFGDPEEEGDDGFEEFEDGEQNGGKDAQ